MISKQELWASIVVARLRAGYSRDNAIVDADVVLVEFENRWGLGAIRQAAGNQRPPYAVGGLGPNPNYR